MTSFGTAKQRTVEGKGQRIDSSRPAASVEELVQSTFPDDLISAAAHGSLTEDLALDLLSRRDLPAQALEGLARNSSVVKHRKVLIALIEHQRTPRHVSLPLLRRLFVFELMSVALAPAVAADIKLFAEELLIAKLETLSLGESISLARRASTAVAGALLLRPDRAVIEAALQNSRTTEASIVKALAKPDVPGLLLSMLMHHSSWSLRREIQIGILRRPEATEEVVLRVAAKLSKSALRDLIEQVRLPQSREALLRKLESQTI